MEGQQPAVEMGVWRKFRLSPIQSRRRGEVTPAEPKRQAMKKSERRRA